MRYRAMRGNAVTQHHDQRTINSKEVLPPSSMRAACTVKSLNSDTVAHDLTPSNLGVRSVTPSLRSSNVVAPTTKLNLPSAGKVMM